MTPSIHPQCPGCKTFSMSCRGDPAPIASFCMNSTFARLLSLVVLPGGLALAADSTNLLHNPGFENANEAWTLPNTFRVVDEVAHRGTHSLRLSNTNPATYLLARQSVPCQPGLKYRYGAWIKTRGVKGGDLGATLCLEWSGAQGWMGGSYAEGNCNHQRGS
jgi:hypothetical protein